MSKFQGSSATATPIPTLNEIVHFQNGSTFQHSESNFWSKHFALGSSGAAIAETNEKTQYDAKHLIITTKSNFPIQSISFRPAQDAPAADAADSKPDASMNKQMAVASGPRVSLYRLRYNNRLITTTIQPDRNIPMADVAYCSDYRADGRLLAIGCANGSIKVVDVNTRATLKTFQARTTNTNLNSNTKSYNHKSNDLIQMGIRSVTWGRDGKKIISGGEDAILRIWDLEGEDTTKPLLELIGHADAIRVCQVLKVPNLHGKDKTTNATSTTASIVAITGSYDHTLRLWDLTQPFYPNNTNNIQGYPQVHSSHFCLSVMDHGAPIEDIVILPTQWTNDTSNSIGIKQDDDSKKSSQLIVLSSGGTMIKMWNARTGTLLHTISNHAKTISSLCLVSPQQLNAPRSTTNTSNDYDDDDSQANKLPRLISGGLDGLVRIYSISIANHSLTALHGIKHKSPITAIHMSPDGMRLLIGTSDGILSMFQRSRAQQIYEQKQLLLTQDRQTKRKAKAPPGGTYSFFMRGADAMPEPDDFVVFSDKKKRLKKFDVALRQFRYSDALDEALATKNPIVVVAILEELSKRRGLTTALSNRDEETLEPLLSFTTRYIAQPKYATLLIGVSNLLCKIYGPHIGQSAIIDELFRKLRRHVKREIGAQRNLLRMVGQIDSFLFQTIGNPPVLMEEQRKVDEEK